MNEPIKLFFDNCLSKRLPKALRAAYGDEYPSLRVKHLTEYFSPSDLDEDWLPLLEEEKDWIVITADKGLDSKTAKLPLICSQLKITHICMSFGLHNAGYLAHKHAMLSLFPQLLCVSYIPKGTRIAMIIRAYHRRSWPYLMIDGHPFDSWCIKNDVKTPGLEVG